MASNESPVSEPVPKSDFIQVYNEWRAGRFLIILKTRAVHADLKVYLKGLKVYLTELYARRRQLNLGHHEINITICKVNEAVNEHQSLESHTENLGLTSFDEAFDSMAAALEIDEEYNPFPGNIEVCIVQEFTPLLGL